MSCVVFFRSSSAAYLLTRESPKLNGPILRCVTIKFDMDIPEIYRRFIGGYAGNSHHFGRSRQTVRCMRFSQKPHLERFLSKS
jgi:hypothetical protein